jgi:hypothetical protein
MTQPVTPSQSTQGENERCVECDHEAYEPCHDVEHFGDNREWAYNGEPVHTFDSWAAAESRASADIANGDVINVTSAEDLIEKLHA